MKYLPSFILSVLLLGLWSCSDSGDPVGTDCSVELDCAGDCGGSATEDECGICGGDGSSCYIRYSLTIQPIFNTNCTSCHGSSGGLSLASYSDLMLGTSDSGPVVISENGSESYLIKKMRGADTISGSPMPQSACCLDESIIQLIETWINEGALDN